MASATQFERDDRVARLTLDRPEKNNAVNIQLLDEVIAHVEGLTAADDVRVLTLRGAGGNFSAGADLTRFKAAVDSGNRDWVDEFIGKIHEATRALEVLDLPVIAAVEGYALAGGIEFMLATDLRIVTESAVIGDQHANFNLVAGGGGTQRLVRQIPTAVANELMYTGRRLSGTEALDVGLVNSAVPESEFDATLAELEATLASKSGNAQALTKRLMREGQATDLERGLQLERHAVIQYYFSDDARAGLAAFEEGRDPDS